MKKIFYSLLGLIVITAFFGCEDDYDPSVTPPTSLSFVSDDVLVSFLPDSPVYPLTVYATNVSNQDRTINLTLLEGVDEDTALPYDTSLPGDYEIASLSVTIPAGEYSGSTNITFDSEMTLGETRWVSFKIDEVEGYVLNNTTNEVTVSYTPKCPFNGVNVDITTDRWGTETTWEIVNSNGVTVADGGPYVDLATNTTAVQPTVKLCLEDGNYVFYMYDSYGDGMVTSASVVGSFKVSTESGDILVQDVGNFTFSAMFEFSLP